RFFADERNGIHRNPFATDVVPIGLRDRAEGHLSDLGPAAHDDDALAVNLRERRRQLDVRDAAYLPQISRESFDVVTVGGKLEVNLWIAIPVMNDIDVADVRLMVGEDLGESEQHAGLIRNGGQNGQVCHRLRNVTRTYVVHFLS